MRRDIIDRSDVGGVLVTPRFLTCKELRGERATYTIQANVPTAFSPGAGYIRPLQRTRSPHRTVTALA